ncbi:alcohol dehydrogenase, partial [Scenedesmus sp. NREL 46B-D3]
MRAIVCQQLGDPTLPLGSGVLELKEDQPAPEIKHGCIRIRVTAASLNFPDALQVKGQYQVKPKLPFTPGSEVSGIVCQLGASVAGFKPGDLVRGACAAA